jgi:NAD(P)-dependent dehydrogenase (short-subunit alcohol dehydrogenase family)/acyl carrier protein
VPTGQAAPRRAPWTINGHLVRTADGQPVAGGLRPATQAPRIGLAAQGASAPGTSALGASVPGAGAPGASAPAGTSAQAAGAPGNRRDEVVTEFLRTTRELIAAQREVVLGYLGATPPPSAPVPAAQPQIQPNFYTERISAAPPTPPPAPPAPAESAATGPTAPTGPEAIADAVVSVISARTGYPADMLGADLDLEADLSVDSIKRTEIITALAGRLGLTTEGTDAESVVEELAKIKTISGLTDWLTEHTGHTGHTGGDGPAEKKVVADEPPSFVPDKKVGRFGSPRRFTVEPTALAAADGGAPHIGGRYVIVDDGRGIALELADLLEQRGATAVTTDAPSDAELAAADALVHLGALRPGGRPVLPGGFGAVRAALLGGARAVLAATGSGGSFGRACGPEFGTESGPESDPPDLGLRGMMRTIAAEYPGVLARAVDVEPKDSPRTIAAQLLAELTDPAGPPVTGYRDGKRTGLLVREVPAVAAAVPALDDTGVVVLTGGARGITAGVALALARATGCHIELLGRSALPPVSPDHDVAGVTDPAELRRLLIARGLRSPREIESEAGRLARENEIRATLEALRASAASVRYHAVDVRDTAAVAAVLADIYARHDRIDGVIHGAGVLEDSLIPDKTPESFARVYATKVDGARGLLAGLRDDVRFAALFGSVSGVFGNRGQADYSAANDALDTLAHLWSGKIAGRVAPVARVVSVDWGPWAGGGMVSPELEREYARRGVALIDPAEGVAALLAELAAPSGPAQVVYMCGSVPGEVPADD